MAAADLLVEVPPFAPVPCWCSFIKVASIIMASGSAFMDNMRRMSFQTSSLAHSRKRLCTVFQGPNSGCKSRYGAPVFIIHRIALNIRRSSLRLRPLVSVPAFANIGPIMAHFSSEMSCLLREKQKQQTDETSRFYLETAPRARLGETS